MKKIFIKSIAIAITTSLFCTTSISAQGFLNKLKKATDKVESVSKTVESVTGTTTASTEEQGTVCRSTGDGCQATGISFHSGAD